MISALLGTVIMSAATVSLLVAINISEKSLKNVGKYPLTNQEKDILIQAGFNNSDITMINQEIELLNFED